MGQGGNDRLRVKRRRATVMCERAGRADGLTDDRMIRMIREQISSYTLEDSGFVFKAKYRAFQTAFLQSRSNSIASEEEHWREPTSLG